MITDVAYPSWFIQKVIAQKNFDYNLPSFSHLGKYKHIHSYDFNFFFISGVAHCFR